MEFLFKHSESFSRKGFTISENSELIWYDLGGSSFEDCYGGYIRMEIRRKYLDEMDAPLFAIKRFLIIVSERIRTSPHTLWK